MTLRVVGYRRVSTSEQAQSGGGLGAQQTTIKAEARRRRWDLLDIYTDRASGKAVTKRPALEEALAVCAQGDADALVVAKVDRLSRSLIDFASLMERSRREGWALVALDIGVDCTTPAGEMVANIMATFAQYERRLIGERTRAGLAAKRADGVVLGRRAAISPEVLDRIVSERTQGRTYAAIAQGLEDDRVQTAHGGARWYPATVRAAVQSREGQGRLGRSA